MLQHVLEVKVLHLVLRRVDLVVGVLKIALNYKS